MANVWTHGVWTVKPGRESDFIAIWRELARRGSEELNTAGPPTLLRNLERSNEFVSFGPWPSLDEVERFRPSEIFQRAQEELRDVLDDFVPRTLHEVTAGG